MFISKKEKFTLQLTWQSEYRCVYKMVQKVSADSLRELIEEVKKICQEKGFHIANSEPRDILGDVGQRGPKIPISRLRNKHLEVLVNNSLQYLAVSKRRR